MSDSSFCKLGKYNNHTYIKWDKYLYKTLDLKKKKVDLELKSGSHRVET